MSHTYWRRGGQIKVFQPLCLCIIINVCLYSNILDCFNYSVFIKKYRIIEAGVRTQSNLSEGNVCVKLTSWAHESPYSLLLATKTKAHSLIYFFRTTSFDFWAPDQWRPLNHSLLQAWPLASKNDHIMETKPFLVSYPMYLRRVDNQFSLPCQEPLEEKRILIGHITTDHWPKPRSY